MAYIVPKNTPIPTSGDTSYWEACEILESPTNDGPITHQALIQARLDEMKTGSDIPVTVKAITTLVYTAQAPILTQFYSTTICYSVLGSPNVFPAP